jgi:hypothetical protein
MTTRLDCTCHGGVPKVHRNPGRRFGYAVLCDCGAMGPWSRTEELARIQWRRGVRVAQFINHNQTKGK